MPSDRVALIAVHGVADQQPGETARALVGLLVASPPEDPGAALASDGSRPHVRYESHSEHRLTIQVDPLRPRGEPTAPRNDATPLAEDRPVLKSFLQSFRSDLQRSGWHASSGMTKAWQESSKPPPEAGADRGLAVTNYLLTKHIDNGAHAEAYETLCIGLDRETGAGSSRIDVYEMYWADLSRLSGQVPRILTELFTLVFRLSKLGRDTVDEARGRIVAQPVNGFAQKARRMLWSVLAALQSGLDWLFVNVLALLFLQLALLVAMLGGFGLLLRLQPHVAHVAVGLALGFGALLWLAYHRRDGKPSSLVAPAFVLGLAVLLLVAWNSAGLWTAAAALLVLAVATGLSEFGLGVAEDRFPFVRTTGRMFWAVTVLVVLAAAGDGLTTADTTAPLEAMGAEILALHSWMHATLFATEVVLYVVKLWWEIAAILLVLWFLLGGALSFQGDYAPRASIATGRLGLAISLGTFLTLTMAAWALLTTVTDVAAGGIAYSSCIFLPSDRPASAPPSAPRSSASPSSAAGSVPSTHLVERQSNTCPFGSDAAEKKRGSKGRVTSPPTAAQYLDDRFSASTESFALLAGLLSLLAIYLAVIFVPSVLAELKVLVGARRQAFHRTLQSHGKAGPRDPAAQDAATLRSRRLGRWLSGGYRHLDVVVWSVVCLGVIAAIGVAVIFVGRFRADWQIVLPWGGGSWTLAQLETGLRDASHTLLAPLYLTAAGAAAFTASGGFLSKHVPTIRAPLDVVLDVDNYFRDFPRTNIPRARIFSRYAALLGHIRQQGYDALVVVSHSQGTVISTELFRFLSSDGCHPPRDGRRPCLDIGNLPPLSLLTLGCPLRQLYASRFPYLYDWVINPNKGLSGPRASDIGAERWANAFSSGDYVGRWLRSDSSDPKDPVGHPMSDLVDDRDGRGLGRIDAYAGFVPMPPAAALLEHMREIEVCLGVGAHTHYFEPDQSTVAWLVDHLIGTSTQAVGPDDSKEGPATGSRARAPGKPVAGEPGMRPGLLALGSLIACAFLFLTAHGRSRRKDARPLANQEPRSLDPRPEHHHKV